MKVSKPFEFEMSLSALPEQQVGRKLSRLPEFVAPTVAQRLCVAVDGVNYSETPSNGLEHPPQGPLPSRVFPTSSSCSNVQEAVRRLLQAELPFLFL